MLRLGVVSFLNSRPLIEGLEAGGDVTCVFDVPAALRDRLDRGEVDVALVPIIDVLRGHQRYRVVSDACIGCDGETMTVRVFSQVPPHQVHTLWVDPDSHTSVALASIVWRDLFDRELTIQPFQTSQHSIDNLESVLLIGDKVVNPRRGSFAYEVDLGGAWRQHTGLPFVFAVWAAATSAAAADGGASVAADAKATVAADVSSAEVAAQLSAARDCGVARAAEIADACGPPAGWPVELARRYLTRCLKYKLDQRSVEGANRFARRCRDLGLVPADAAIPWPESIVRDGCLSR